MMIIGGLLGFLVVDEGCNAVPADSSLPSLVGTDDRGWSTLADLANDSTLEASGSINAEETSFATMTSLAWPTRCRIFELPDSGCFFVAGRHWVSSE